MSRSIVNDRSMKMKETLKKNEDREHQYIKDLYPYPYCHLTL